MKGYLRKRCRASWEITIDTGREPATGKRRRHYESVKGTKKEAQLRLAELMVTIEQGTYIKQRRYMTLETWLRQWLDGHALSNLAAKTIDSYKHELGKYVIPSLGSVRLSELRPHHIQRYITKALTNGRRLRAGGLSHRTVQYHYRILSKSMDDAIKMGLIMFNPCKGISPPRPSRINIPALGPDELNKLISAIKESSFYLYYYTLLLTGLRRSELLALKWNEVALDQATIYVSHSLDRLNDGSIVIKEPKSACGRRPVDLPISLVKLLRKHKANQEIERLMLSGKPGGDDFVFSNADGTPLNPQTVTHAFAKTIKRAGMSSIRLHDLRHIHATMLLKAGVHPKVVQERLGHSSITTTLDIYSHTVPGLQKAAAQHLDTLLSDLGKAKNVGKMSATHQEVERRPCRSRTCDTLIKSQVL